MDIEELRKLALAAEREYSEALRENEDECDYDDTESISSKLDNIDAADIDINENVILRPKSTPIFSTDERVSTISSKYTVEEPEEIDTYEQRLRHGVPKELKVEGDIRCSDISGKYIVEEPEESMVKKVEPDDKANEPEEQGIESEVTIRNNRVEKGEHVAVIEEVSDNLKENDQVKYILEELITTEFEYLKSLHFLLTSFLKPIRKILNKKDYRIVKKVSNILKMIDRFGTMFLEDLSAAHLDIRLFGEIFKRHRTMFNLYTNLSRVWYSFTEIIEKPEVEAKIKKIEIDLNEAIGFSRYILKPIQRITKYELLLNQILKNLSVMKDKNIAKLEAARDFLHDVLKRCDTIVALKSILNQDYDENHSGYFIMRTSLKRKITYKKKRKMLRPIELFLFERVIIIAIIENEELYFEDSITVSNLLSPVNEPQSARFTLEDSKNRRAFRLEAPTIQAKEKCLKSIDDILWNLLKSLKQRQTESLQLGETTGTTK